MSFQFAANISLMFREYPSLDQRYQAAKDAGFKAVECQFPYDIPIDRLRQAKWSSGLEHVLINSYPGKSVGDIGFAALLGHEAEFKQSLDLSLQYANALGASKIHIMAGCPRNQTAADSEAIYIKNLKYAATLLQKANIIGVIEPLCKEVREGYYLNSYDQALDIVSKVKSNNIRVLLDTFHMQMIHGNLTSYISKCTRYVGHIQISQAPKRQEPGVLGEIDHRYVLQLFKDLGYNGYIGLEYCPSGSTLNSLRWIEEYGYSL